MRSVREEEALKKKMRSEKSRKERKRSPEKD